MAIGPVAATLAIQAGGTILGRLFAGSRPDVDDYVPEQSILSQLGNIQREQFRQASTALALGSRKAVEDLKAAGVTGSGLGSSLSGVFGQVGNTLNNLQAQQADARIAAEERDLQRQTALGLQDYQSDVEARAARAEGIAQLASSASDYVAARQSVKDMSARDDKTMAFFEKIFGREDSSQGISSVPVAPAASAMVSTPGESFSGMSQFTPFPKLGVSMMDVPGVGSSRDAWESPFANQQRGGLADLFSFGSLNTGLK